MGVSNPLGFQTQVLVEAHPSLPGGLVLPPTLITLPKGKYVRVNIPLQNHLGKVIRLRPNAESAVYIYRALFLP